MALWERLVLAQAQGKAQAREQNEGGRESERPQANPEKTTRTNITQRNNITIRRSSIVLDETDGELKEMMIKSTSSFGIELEVNDKQLIHKTMPELIEVSEDLGYIVAVLRDGYYRFSITDILFDHIFMRIFLDGNGTFDIYCNAEISQPLVSGTREVCKA